MRKSWWLAIALTGVALGAGACGDSGPSVSVQARPAQEAPTTTSSTPASSTTSTLAPTTTGAPSTRAVTFRGIQLAVPANWPVYDLGTDTKRCVRYDHHAVFLGAQGADPDCPARLIGRTETVQVQPLGAGTKSAEALATKTLTTNGLSARIDPESDISGALTVVLPDQSLLVTITFGLERIVADQILQSLRAA